MSSAGQAILPPPIGLVLEDDDEDPPTPYAVGTVGRPGRLAGLLRRPMLAASVGDVLLGCGFAFAGLIEVLLRMTTGSEQSDLSASGSLALLSLAWRRRSPLLPVVLLTGMGVVTAAAGIAADSGVGVTGLLLAAYSLGAYAGSRTLAIGATLPPLMVTARTGLGMNTHPPFVGALAFFAICVVAVPAVVGRVIRSRGRLVDELEERRAQLLSEQEARASEALAAERLDIMSRLDTVVSRGIQTLLAEVTIAETDTGERGRASAGQIESTARSVLGQIRELLIMVSDGPPLAAESNRLAAAPTARPEDRPGPEKKRPGWWKRSASRYWPSALAVACFLGLELQLQDPPHTLTERGVYVLAGMAIATPLAWCRGRPLLTVLCAWTAAGLVSSFVVPLSTWAAPVGMVFALPFLVAELSDLRPALLGLIGSALGVSAVFGPAGLAGASVILLGAWAAGRVLRDRTTLVAKLGRTNRQLAEERGARARLAVIAERARLARELHDVIGHTLAVVVLQAGAARRLWDEDHAQAVEALQTVSRVSREGLSELLSSLDSLSSGLEERMNFATLTRTGGLVDTARRAGLSVDLAVEGVEVPLDSDLEHAAYRVLQEALTNVLKHAPEPRAEVTIRYQPGQLELQVANRCPAVKPGGASGLGLIGMHERVRACGGRLEAGADRDQHFAVRASLPLHRLPLPR